jgi:hypothetical protein
MTNIKNMKPGVLLMEEEACSFTNEVSYCVSGYYILLEIENINTQQASVKLYCLYDKKIFVWHIDTYKFLYLDKYKDYSDQYFRMSIIC